MDSIEHKFVYQNLDCTVTYRKDSQFRGFCPKKITVFVGDKEKSHSFNELRILNPEEKCKDFLIYQTEKFIDNGFEAKEEDIKVFFLKTNPDLSEDEKQKVYNFFTLTNEEFNQQLQELELSNDKDRFLEVFGSVREKMVRERDLADKKIIDIESGKVNQQESYSYLKYLYAEREGLFQYQLQKITHKFKIKFNEDIWSIYKDTDHSKKASKTRNQSIKVENQGSKEIDWGNSKNVIIAFVVIIIVLLIIGFRSQTKKSDYDQAVRESILKNHNPKDGPIDCTGAKSKTPECQYLLNLPYDPGGDPLPYP